jgi:hypothetical protein
VSADRVPPQRDGLVHVLITARDETSAYRVFDALVERFPGVEPPDPCPSPHDLVVFSVLAPTLGSTPAPPLGQADRRPGRAVG